MTRVTSPEELTLILTVQPVPVPPDVLTSELPVYPDPGLDIPPLEVVKAGLTSIISPT